MSISVIYAKIGMFFSAFALFLLVDAMGVKQQARWKLSAMKYCLLLTLLLAPTLFILQIAHHELFHYKVLDLSEPVRTVLTLESNIKEGFSQITDKILKKPDLESPKVENYTSQVEVSVFPREDFIAGQLMVLWVAVTGSIFLFHGVCYLVYAFRKRESVELSQELEEICPYPVFLEESLCSPVVIGVFFPKILLPEKEYATEDIRFILLHEVTHIKKRDLLWKNVAFFVRTIHWYNPFAYYLARRFETVLELSCDEAIATPLDFQGRKDYGLSVLSVMMGGKNPPKGSGTPMALGFVKNKKSLEKRLVFMLSCDGTRKYSHLLYVGFCLLLLTGGAFSTYHSFGDLYQYHFIKNTYGSSSPDHRFIPYMGQTFTNSFWSDEAHLLLFDDIHQEKIRIQGKSVAPYYVDLFMEKEGSELVATYAGFYTDFKGDIVDYLKEIRIELGENIVFMNIDSFTPYTLSPTVEQIYPEGLPIINFTQEEQMNQAFAQLMLSRFEDIVSVGALYSPTDEIKNVMLLCELGTTLEEEAEEVVEVVLEFFQDYPEYMPTEITDLAIDRTGATIYQETPTS